MKKKRQNYVMINPNKINPKNPKKYIKKIPSK